MSTAVVSNKPKIGSEHYGIPGGQASEWLRPVPATTKFLFAATSFLSAFLLFQMQLIVSKYILPWFGGSSAVWTTSMLVFQMLLLCGYVYSHLVSARLSPVTQVKLHLALLTTVFLLVFALMFLWPSAITPGPSWKPADSGNPVRDVCVVLLVSAGLPFFVLSTTGPLLQRWFTHLGVGTKTYKLYSISNLGSLLGLLSFPFLLEPTLRMKTQSLIWSLLFFVFVVGCYLCALKAQRAHEAGSSVEEAEETGGEVQSSPLIYSLWLLLPACASALLLATTNLLCQEVTSVPLVWVLPLSLYLFSFILCFDNPRWYQRSFFHPIFAISLFLTCAALIVGSVMALAILLPAALFLACMICHGELVRLKPSVKRLTSFYLTISAGGAAGGIFVAIVAPRMFTFFTEFQLTLGFIVILLLVCLFLDPASWFFEGDFRLPSALASGAILTAYLVGLWFPGVAELLDRLRFYPFALLIGAFVILSTYILNRGQRSGKRGFRFVQVYVLCIAVVAFAALYRSTQSPDELYLSSRLSSRNFYGAVRVYRLPFAKSLANGQTLHGAQLDPPNDKEPTTYYGKRSGIGILLENHPKRSIPGQTLRVGVVGLGAGTLAAYGRPGDYFRFYEINPDVVNLSSGPQPAFTYLRDSHARIDVESGDARLLLERELARGDKQKFDVLILDAFSGDAIPVHLLTQEAFETYWQHLDPNDGIIAVHVTSRHVNLLPVLQGVSAYFHADSALNVNSALVSTLRTSVWVFLTRSPGALNIQGLKQAPNSFDKQVPPRLWTDDHSDILRLIR